MDGKLKVAPEALKSAASLFQSKATQVKALHDDMISRVNSLSASWIGEEAKGYSGKFKALQTSMDKIYAQITEHVNDLNEMADKYIGVKTTVGAAVSDLPASEI